MPIVTAMNKPDETTRVLLVDDDIIVRTTLSSHLSVSGFTVTTSGSVAEALKLICFETFDVLLSDLHMPGAGDGLTVISAMRHTNPRAVTLLLSAFPEMTAASRAIVEQADEVLTKPIDLTSLIDVIRQRVSAGPVGSREMSSVAEIVSRNAEAATQLWYDSLKKEEKVASLSISSSISMTYEQRCAHLPQFFHELACRLQSPQPIGGKQKLSSAAGAHGVRRRQQGYSAAMLVEESRVLQVSIFQILQNNLASIDFSLLLNGVMVIADEVASQLSQSMTSYLESIGEPHRMDRLALNQGKANQATYGG
jgi:CheY-like chemotaxis protein